MKINVDKDLVRGVLNFVKLELGTAAMAEQWRKIREDWKVNPLSVKEGLKETLKNMQAKIAALDDFLTTIMVAAEKAMKKVKEYSAINIDDVAGAAKLEACAQFLDKVVSFPKTFVGMACEFFDKEIFYFLLQLIFHFRKTQIEMKGKE
jgi:hypothetical protein